MNKNLRRMAASLIVVGVALTGLTGCSQNYDGDTTACKVTDKDRTRDSDGNSQARVYTSCGVFEVVDDFTHGIFNSADTFGSIQVGHTYDFDAYGFRNGFLSSFPNIKAAHEVSDGQE